VHSLSVKEPDPNSTMGDLIQSLVIFSHMKLNPIFSFICLFKKIKDPNKTASISTWFLNIFLLPTTNQIIKS
jgi:hypothetical protein